ncbi:MAG: UDP-3-O-[3-hydroxymyristoyl] N-acetylglucosamine deacetylase [Alphaproteobacteria bacterium]|nr:UDP-3-O-[3-hydroxymyristoyl] N-acetylglucosamine deacetylase [Alphaproteobacteria bacterium]
MQNQKTIKNKIVFTGIGQHKGTLNTIELFPADIDTGIVFEIKGQKYQLNLNNVFGETGYTCIGEKDGVNVKTIEHLVSSLHGLGIDNLVIKTESEEIPIQDGSALPLLKEIEEKAGFLIQNAPKKAIKILKKVEYSDEKGSVSIEPSDKGLLTLDVTIDYSGIKPIGIEQEIIDLTEENYKSKICMARTFARMSDVEYLHSKGLCLGATLKSGIAVDEEKIINPEGLREPNEFVFHKILDAIGDLYVMGHSIIGFYKNSRGGHFHNNQLVRKVMSDESNYEIVEL